MTTYPSSLFMSLALASFLFTGLPCSIQAMEEEHKGLNASPPHKVLSEKEKKQLAINVFDSGMQNLVREDYSAAFHNFVYVAFKGIYTAKNFEETTSDKDYLSSLLSSFGYHIEEPRQEDQRRFAAFGYVYTLWKTNKNGLSKESLLGKAMEKCVAGDNVYVRGIHRLIGYKCPPDVRSLLLEKSKDWTLQPKLKRHSDK